MISSHAGRKSSLMVNGLTPKDDICVPKGCECQIPGLDGSLCPLWCAIECNANQIKCPGQEDENGCKETDVCIDKAVGEDGQLCPGYCPSECDVQAQHSCFTPPENGCPQAPTCEQKQTDAAGHTCDEQHCPVTCSEDEACFPGDQKS